MQMFIMLGKFCLVASIFCKVALPRHSQHIALWWQKNTSWILCFMFVFFTITCHQFFPRSEVFFFILANICSASFRANRWPLSSCFVFFYSWLTKST